MRTAEQQKAAGNEAFKRKEYAAAAKHYSSALQELEKQPETEAAAPGSSTEPCNSHLQLRVTLLANRSLALFRLGRYHAAAKDAQAALALHPTHGKAAFRAAAALLMLGDAAAAVDMVQAIRQAGGEVPAGGAALAAHAAALLTHQQQVQRRGSSTDHQHAVGLVLGSLAAEAAGEAEDDVDPTDLLQQLTSLLDPSTSYGSVESAAEAAAALEAPGSQGYPLLLFYLASALDPPAKQAAQVLQAAAMAAARGSSAVLWPPLVWQRLTSLATDCSPGSSEPAVAAMQLLSWAAARDSWVATHVLLHPLPGSSAPTSPLEQILALLLDSGKLHQLSPAVVTAAADLVRQYASDAALTGSLLGCRPLLALLHAAASAEGMEAFRIPADAEDPSLQPDSSDKSIARSDGATPAPTFNSREEMELHGLQQLRLKRQKVFNAELVALRRSLLSAACQLAASSRELVQAEAVEVKQGGDGEKRTAAAGAFLTGLLDLVRDLHQQQPQRTAPQLGPDGTPQTFIKRRLAADFKDNPTGDYLVSLELQDGNDVNPLEPLKTKAAEDEALQGCTVLELVLGLLHHTAGASSSTAALLYRRKLFPLCQELQEYCTPAVVAAAQQLYAAVADRVASAADEVFQGKGVAPVAALFVHSTKQQHQLKAAEQLLDLVIGCTGDEFALLTAASGGGGSGGSSLSHAKASVVHRAWELALSKPGKDGAAQQLQQTSLKLLLRCCGRAQQQQQLAAQLPPRGGAWTAIGRQALQKLLTDRREEQHASAQQPQEQGFVSLKRGFLGKPASAAGRASGGARTQQQGTHAALGRPLSGGDANRENNRPAAINPSAHSYKSGAVLIEELPAEPAPAGVEATAGAAVASVPPAAPLPRQAADTAAEPAEGEEEEDLPDLKDVYDSSSSSFASAQQRQSRAAWMAMPPAKRLRWLQTSVEVSAYFAVPAGTQASEVQVAVTSDKLTVSLKWFGRIFEGRLHRRVKHSESKWCLEDAEVHVMLVKAAADEYWKALHEGGEERGLLELLKEAVHADEPAPSYEDLSDEAKWLARDFREREALLRAGLLDPENLLDERIVLGEESLRGRR